MADNETPAVVSGSTAAVKTMADNTLRITIDIEPRHAQAAFAMFGMRGTPVAVARLTPEAAVEQTRKDDAPDFGKSYEVLFKMGWFYNPRVQKAFAPANSIDEIKGRFYEEFRVDSLAKINPTDFIDLARFFGIADTLPRDFA